jgi:hypothetical protein
VQDRAQNDVQLVTPLRWGLLMKGGNVENKGIVNEQIELTPQCCGNRRPHLGIANVAHVSVRIFRISCGEYCGEPLVGVDAVHRVPFGDKFRERG